MSDSLSVSYRRRSSSGSCDELEVSLSYNGSDGDPAELEASTDSNLSESEMSHAQHPAATGRTSKWKPRSIKNSFNRKFTHFKGKLKSSSSQSFEYSSPMEFLGLEERLKVMLREEMNTEKVKPKEEMATEWYKREKEMQDLKESRRNLICLVEEEKNLRTLVEQELRDKNTLIESLQAVIEKTKHSEDLRSFNLEGFDSEELGKTVDSEELKVLKKAEAKSLRIDKEMMAKKIEELQNEIEAQKAEVDTLNRDFEKEYTEREKINSDKYEEWKIHEQELKEQLEHTQSILSEQNQTMTVNFKEYQENLIIQDTKIEHITLQLERRELEILQKVEEIVRVTAENELLRERLHSIHNQGQEKDQSIQPFTNVKRADVTIKGVLDGGAWGTISAGMYRGSKVAIKQPHQWIMHKSTVDRMKREACNMARMHHPNLVTFIGGVFNDGKLPMIIIEMMEANLRATYKKTDLTKDQMVSIFKDVAYALHYLHEFREPIIHRDLSAPNVLVKSLPGNRFVAKVADFGSANIAKLAKTVAEGCVIYSAPESFPSPMGATSTPKQTVKMDTFSYGILLCEVINRKQPDPESRIAMVKAVAGKWSSMHSLVLRCVKDEAAQRPTMAGILDYLRHK